MSPGLEQFEGSKGLGKLPECSILPGPNDLAVLLRSWETFLALIGSLKGGSRCGECKEGNIISLKDSN